MGITAQVGARRANKLFYSFWITSQRGKALSVSTRHRFSGLWSLAGALTFHIGLHFLLFSGIFREKGIGRIDRYQFLAT
jgi:hypothetical protein